MEREMKRRQGSTRPSRGRGVSASSALTVLRFLQPASAGAQADPAPVRRVRVLQTRKVGVARPAGLAFSPRPNAFLVLAERGV